jgi:pantoate--beta-alanine ligase
MLGFVPTMGALHEGHLSLVRAARKECDRVVVSVFVNPTQFEPAEDLASYPHDEARDRALLEAEGVDDIWFPTMKDIYPEGIDSVDSILPPESLTKVLCGIDRPHHFEGVATVVKRLFEKVKPTDVYFGQKDFQQTRVIDWLINEYFKGVKLHVLPTIRESDGLAMSSRNVYLSDIDRSISLELSRSLGYLNKLFIQGEVDVRRLQLELSNRLNAFPEIEVKYAEIRDAKGLNVLDNIQDDAVVAVAAIVGKTRLIDNIVLHA